MGKVSKPEKLFETIYIIMLAFLRFCKNNSLACIVLRFVSFCKEANTLCFILNLLPITDLISHKQPNVCWLIWMWFLILFYRMKPKTLQFLCILYFVSKKIFSTPTRLFQPPPLIRLSRVFSYVLEDFY